MMAIPTGLLTFYFTDAYYLEVTAMNHMKRYFCWQIGYCPFILCLHTLPGYISCSFSTTLNICSRNAAYISIMECCHSIVLVVLELWTFNEMVAEAISTFGWHLGAGDKQIPLALLCVAECTRASIKSSRPNSKSCLLIAVSGAARTGIFIQTRILDESSMILGESLSSCLAQSQPIRMVAIPCGCHAWCPALCGVLSGSWTPWMLAISMGSWTVEDGFIFGKPLSKWLWNHPQNQGLWERMVKWMMLKMNKNRVLNKCSSDDTIFCYTCGCHLLYQKFDQALNGITCSSIHETLVELNFNSTNIFLAIPIT